MTSEFECIVSGDLMRRAWKSVGTDPFRFYLGGVYVEPHPEGGAAIVSTNCHTMLLFHDKGGIVRGSGIVRLSPETRKACRKDGAFVVVRNAKLSVVCAKEAGEIAPVVAHDPDETVLSHQWANVLIHGVFPDYRKVVPKESGTHFAAINPKLVAAVGEALADTSGYGITICGAADNYSPHIVIPNSVVPGFGLIMGMRGHEARWSRPEWLSPEPHAEAAE